MTDMESVQGVLTANGISFEVDPALTWDTQTMLIVPISGAHLVIDPERGNRLVKAMVAA